MKTVRWLLIILVLAGLAALAVVFWPQIRTLCRSMSVCRSEDEHELPDEEHREAIETN